MAALELDVVKLGSWLGDWLDNSGTGKPSIRGSEAEGTLATPTLSKVRSETGAEGSILRIVACKRARSSLM